MKFFDRKRELADLKDIRKASESVARRRSWSSSPLRRSSWWDRKGENEIDILAENELTGKYAVCEVKRQGGKIDLAAVRKKCEAFRCATGEWRKVVPTYKALSLKDM